MNEDKEPLDYHCFEIWRYTDGTFDLNAKVHEGKFDLHTASIAAAVLTRCMREDVRKTRLCYAVELYNDGQTSAYWRDDEQDLATNFKEFLWAKRALHRGTYGALIPFPKMPSWIINGLGGIEFLVAKIWKIWVKISGLGAGYTVEKYSATGVGPPPAPTGQEASDELPEGLEGIVEHTKGNVVWVKRWGTQKDNSEN